MENQPEIWCLSQGGGRRMIVQLGFKYKLYPLRLMDIMHNAHGDGAGIGRAWQAPLQVSHVNQMKKLN